MRLGTTVTPLAYGVAVTAIAASLSSAVVAETLTVTGIELGAGMLTLTLLAPLMPLLFPSQAGALFELPDTRNAILLVLLALACTLLPFALSLVALRHMSAFAAQLAINLEPVYAIALAALLLNEQRELSPQFYLGVAIVLGAVFVHPWLVKPRSKPPQDLLAAAEAKNLAD